MLWADPSDLHADARHHGAACRVHRLTVILAPGEIRQPLRRQNRAEVLALRRDDPYSAGAAVPDIALHVDLHAVGKAGPRIGIHVDEDFAVGHRAVGFHIVAHDSLRPYVIDINYLFVG